MNPPRLWMAGAHSRSHAGVRAHKLPLARARCSAQIDVGEGCYWWDYGQLKLYLTNNVLAMKDTEEAVALRDYLKIPDDGTQASELGAGVALSGGSIVLASKIGGGSVNNTIASTSPPASATRTAASHQRHGQKDPANNCIVYNVVDDSEDGLALTRRRGGHQRVHGIGEKLVQARASPRTEGRCSSPDSPPIRSRSTTCTR